MGGVNSMSLRFHCEFTIELRFHFELASKPRRIHFLVTSCHFGFRSISLRIHFYLLFFECPFKLFPAQLRFRFELTSMTRWFHFDWKKYHSDFNACSLRMYIELTSGSRWFSWLTCRCTSVTLQRHLEFRSRQLRFRFACTLFHFESAAASLRFRLDSTLRSLDFRFESLSIPCVSRWSLFGVTSSQSQTHFELDSTSFRFQSDLTAISHYSSHFLLVLLLNRSAKLNVGILLCSGKSREKY